MPKRPSIQQLPIPPRRPALRRVLLPLLLLGTAAAHAADKGWIGIGIAVDGEGAFWNPTIKAVRVAKVAPASPAAQAGLVEGDQILSIEGVPVAGARANDLKPHMDRQVGQAVRLVVRRGSEAPRPVVITAGQKPD